MQREHTRRNPKRHIPLVSLLLRRKMTAVRCLVWLLGLRPWSVSEVDEISGFGGLFTFYIRSLVSVFLLFNAVFHVRWINIIAQR